ncbi:MAG: YrbL family protein [Pseudomonadota bacterium]
MFASHLIILSDQTPLAKGSMRNVFAFPGQPDLLIKVRQVPDAPKGLGKKLAWRWFPESRFWATLKELETDAKATLNLGANIEASPLAKMHGAVQTDCGPGVVVERISNLRGDGLAEPLRKLCAKPERLRPVLEELNRFVRAMFDLRIAARDINVENIVFGRRGLVPGFFLVDGYGEPNVIPLRSLSKRVNDRSHNKRFDRIAQVTPLVWHCERQVFTLE